MLPDRRADSLATWLRAHPGVEIICRDRAGAYAEGARAGAPDALQVADRWHVSHNLAGDVERTVARHRDGLHAAVGAHSDTAFEPETCADIEDDQPAAAPVTLSASARLAAERTDRIASRTRERYAAVHALLDDGLGIRAIAERLGLARGTVRRFARASTAEELLGNNGTVCVPRIVSQALTWAFPQHPSPSEKVRRHDLRSWRSG
jgi:transposase